MDAAWSLFYTMHFGLTIPHCTPCLSFRHFVSPLLKMLQLHNHRMQIADALFRHSAIIGSCRVSSSGTCISNAESSLAYIADAESSAGVRIWRIVHMQAFFLWPVMVEWHLGQALIVRYSWTLYHHLALPAQIRGTWVSAEASSRARLIRNNRNVWVLPEISFVYNVHHWTNFYVTIMNITHYWTSK